MEVIDNVNRFLGDDLKRSITPNSKIAIAAASFSIYAFEALKRELEGIDSLQFIFTTPTFVPGEVTDRVRREAREFHIPQPSKEKSFFGTDFELRLKNKLTQRAIAKECAEWIRRKAQFRSNRSGAPMQQFACVQSSVQDAVYICTIDAGGDGSIADLAKLYRELGKRVFAICDKQTDAKKALIETQVEKLYMHEEHGFEDMVMKNTTEAAMTRFAATFAWPPHLVTKYPNPAANVKAALSEYFAGKKAEWGLADFLAQCAEDEIPQWLCESCISIRELCEPSPAVPVPPSPPAPPQSTVPPA